MLGPYRVLLVTYLRNGFGKMPPMGCLSKKKNPIQVCMLRVNRNAHYLQQNQYMEMMYINLLHLESLQ